MRPSNYSRPAAGPGSPNSHPQLRSRNSELATRNSPRTSPRPPPGIAASSKGVTLPTSLDAKDKAEKDRLSKLSREQFDKAYMTYMVKDHQADVKESQKESQSATDPDVKPFASTTLPTLQEHLKMAESIAPKERAEANSQKSSKNSQNRMKSKGTTSASNPPQL
jgi:hypothetical protein